MTCPNCGKALHAPFWSCWSQVQIRAWHAEARRLWPAWYVGIP